MFQDKNGQSMATIRRKTNTRKTEEVDGQML